MLFTAVYGFHGFLNIYSL